MLLYYFPIAQNTVNKTVSNFFRDVIACICMCTYSTIFLFTGLIPVYLSLYVANLKNTEILHLRLIYDIQLR